MNTPIADFVRDYEKLNMTRLHMPGHKGKSFLGCEEYDITEVAGADSLYEADGIIAESEANAAKLFGTGRTVYSTEGSSQCIRAMLCLAMTNRKKGTKPVVVATRNAHKTFLYTAALLDLEVVWLYPEGDIHSLCSCRISAETVKETLKSLNESPIAVYVTSPDYLGGQLDIQGIAEVCHEHNTILAVDNAHGAYLRFLDSSQHPIDLGADICCDSAHKTLPVLTGGAYLQISKNAPESFTKQAKQAMALFGSTSPSYLVLASLDLCNQYLAQEYKNRLTETIRHIESLKGELRDKGWEVEDTEALKVTIRTPKGVSGISLAEQLRSHQIECEYADLEYIVCMATPENTEEDFVRLSEAIGSNEVPYESKETLQAVKCKSVMTIREAMFLRHETISVADSLGRICASPTVSCPPAIPIVVSGEIIDENAIYLFKHYGIERVDVVKE